MLFPNTLQIVLISSNINEVIKTGLKGFFFFFTKRLYNYKKAQKRLQRTKIRKCGKKHLRGKKLVIH